MTSYSEEEDFTEYGNALDPLDEDSIARKKPFSLQDQVVKDKQGRRRFHGAFTGGFSAGFFNSVGSLEGWTPSTFKSSRSEKAEKTQQNPEDFMDEEDMDEFGIAPKVLRAKSDFNVASRKRGHGHRLSDGPIPGEPVLRELLQPVKDTVGMKLLRKMGWKPGQGIGPRVTKVEKKRLRDEYKKTGLKLYGCSVPQDMNEEKQHDAESADSSDDENNEDLTFAPDDLPPFLCKPKDNCFGLGYSGLDRKPVLSSHVNLFEPTPLRMEEKKKKVLISGQAFGVGAFEEDDDDIYAREDMSQYDFALDSLPTTSKPKQQGSMPSLPNYAGVSLVGFILGTVQMSRKKHFPPPHLPQGFQAFHVIRKTRFEPLQNTESTSQNVSRKKGLQRHTLTATERASIISESVPRSVSQEDNMNNKTQEENKRLSAEALKVTEKIAMPSKEGYSNFQPFVAYPEKQQRYEHYLVLCKGGQKDRLSYFQPLTMTEWERERERIEFEQAARLYQPLTGVMSDRFVSASVPEDVNAPLPPASEVVDSDSEKKAAAKLKMFGKLTREESDWRPCSLLCKRFNIPELFPGADDTHNTTQKSKSKFSVFDFLDVSSYTGNTSQKILDDSSVNEFVKVTPSTSEVPEVTIKQESEMEMDESETTIPEVSSEHKTDANSTLEFPDPPAKIDLYKAIFLSSSEESESDNEKDSENKVKELQSKDKTSDEKTRNGSSSQTVEPVSLDEIPLPVVENSKRNTSPPRGIFANLDLDAINARQKDKSVVPENKKPLDIINSGKYQVIYAKKDEEDNTPPQIQEEMYGPQLPSVPLTVSKPSAAAASTATTINKVLSSVVTSVKSKWVEKTKKDSHKEKHNKKHKKSSKHKKHKHKKKKH